MIETMFLDDVLTLLKMKAISDKYS